ncbi:MAG: hypothetical protein CDV28_12111 [Candidatus Electronema aureum]|uniref:CVNH domain-containing protein n=1 Tax=Candidatus Electronema aureum TaxID=2005002 RepID=A0A521G0V6_9BACT|nr:MAG: hypothetical protein CDV28_12111 [Candidatus Electronema aureum]
MRAKALSALAAALILLAAAGSAQAELGFRNKKSKMLHLDCSKSVKGRFAYTCYDRDGKETHLDEGQEWELLNHQQVCFQHNGGRIRTCHELSKPSSSAKKSYACFDAGGKQSPFTLEKEWKRLAGDDKICAKKLKRFDVPRNMTMPSLNLE